MSVRFDQFMAAALYDEDKGYYTSRIRSVGRQGDFSTSASLSPLLAKGIANWVCQHSPFTPLIEVGPGSGQLAKDIRNYLPLHRRLFLKQYLVEISNPLRKLQREQNPKAKQVSSLKEALDDCGGSALIYSNELVDAFPARVFRKSGERFEELFLSSAENQILEDWQDIVELPDSTFFDQDWNEGQRFEVHQTYHHWLQEWVKDWKGPSMLTVDYGGLPQEVLERRLGGTLRAYFQQQRLEGPAVYTNAGFQDLTCDVNFEDLQKWGQELGLQTTSYQTQREFLNSCAPEKSEDHFLISKDGAGNAFKVLTQSP